VYKLNPQILNAQILYTEPILGSSLYEKLETLIDTNDININTYSDYKTLLTNMIAPSVVFHTLELFIPINSYQIADGGTFQYQPSNASYSPLDDIDRMSKRYQIIGSKYDDKLQRYLCENSNLFAEYTNNTGLVDINKPSIKTGLYLG
jgi:hypothetical protein